VATAFFGSQCVQCFVEVSLESLLVTHGRVDSCQFANALGVGGILDELQPDGGFDQLLNFGVASMF
jgi:hypothetical protein